MNTPQPVSPGAAGARPAEDRPLRAGSRPRRVVDAPTRLAHWLFAASFSGAYLSGDSESWRALHVTLGYVMAGALAFRLLYGLFGPPQARLSLLWRRMAGLPAWIRDALAADARPALSLQKGINLVLALSMGGLLAAAAPLALSGYATHAEWGGEWLEELHEFFANAALALVLLHLGALALLSALRRRNLARPMLTGTADGPGPDLVKSNRGALALALLLAALAFGAWQWRQSPHGLLPDGAGSTGAERGEHGGPSEHRQRRGGHGEDDD